VLVGLLVVALGALWYFGRHSTPPPSPDKGVAQTTVDVPKETERLTPEPGEAIDLPPLDQSDELVRSLASKLSSHPVLAAYLTTDGLIRNMVVVVANIAQGDTPAKQLRVIRPSGAFAVRQSNGATWIDPSSYARYDGIAAAVDSLDARGVARFYATIKPRIDDAWRDLGVGGDFDRTLERAIVMLLATPIPEGDVQVRTSKVTYQFANPSLEGLTKAQRQFLRMGPRNMRIVKAKLRDVAHHLGIADASLPPG
jgi:hypothetical protein